ncbi:MAG: prolyl aminopeptidase [Bdellovibrionales bacterium]|nr:prolyl aminopeptidase [Bdellovibrionales bacterium]
MKLDEILYPPIEPYNTGHIKVSDLHEIYFEEVGNPKGKPVVFLHGGPGGGLDEKYRRFFDPKAYRIVLFDQRGAGRSTPHAELKENTSWELIKDIEKIRTQLGIDKWIVFGGSCGSTLSLLYAETHPDRVNALCLRGIFLCRDKELKWFYQEGACKLYPEAFEEYLKPIPENERSDMIKAYYKRLTSEDKKIRSEAAQAWSIWEGSTSKLLPESDFIDRFAGDEFSLAFARIECHYFINKIFTDSDNYILENVDKILKIPTFIVHGRYDIVCPFESAWELHKKLPNSQLFPIQTAGHSAFETGIATQLVEIMNQLRTS